VAVQVERQDGVVAVRGDLDVEGAPELRRELISAIEEEPGRRLVVDLEGVEFIDSAGLGILVGGRRRARTGDGELVLVATGLAVLRVLELTGLTRAFEIHPTREAALDA
jgi:anti-sigma B factor antagonist